MNFEDSHVENICCHQQMVTGIAVSPCTSKPLNSVNTSSAIMIWGSDGVNTLGVTAWEQILRDAELLHNALKAGCWKSKIYEVQVGGVWSKYCFPLLSIQSVVHLLFVALTDINEFFCKKSVQMLWLPWNQKQGLWTRCLHLTLWHKVAETRRCFLSEDCVLLFGIKLYALSAI